MALGSVPDLVRLVAVPVLGYAAWRDVRTRRVPNETWLPLAALGIALLAHDVLVRLPLGGVGDRLFLVRTALSVGFVVPLAYLFWRIGGFGGADAKALMTLAVLLPTYPTYYLSTVALPLERTTLGVFSMTVLSNTVIVGLAYPLALGVRNALAGDRSPVMFLGRRVPVDELPRCHGRLFENREGFTRSGLDLDALRMYLQWRGTTLDAIRAAPDAHRDPESVGATRDPGDGAVPPADRAGAGGSDPDTDSVPAGTDVDDGVVPGGDAEGAIPGGDADGDSSGDADGNSAADADGVDDPWAAAAFLADVSGDAYGTTPATLRDGLVTVVERDEVWISPGIPFLVPTFVGLVVGLAYGDVLFGLLSAAGLL